MFSKRPELDMCNPPGQIVNRPGSLERIKKLNPVNIYAEMRPQVEIIADASNASDAATPSTDWETRYNGLVATFLSLCDEVENFEDPRNNVTERIRYILSEEP